MSTLQRADTPVAVPDADLVPMAKVGAPFGVLGWVHVYADTEYPDSLFDYEQWHLGNGKVWRPYQLETAKLHGKGLVAKFVGCDDRDQAALLRNLTVAVPRSELPVPEEDEYYWSDLVGMSVVNLRGEALGVVDHLLESAGNDLLVLQGEPQRLIPFVRQIVHAVSLADRQITVDWERDY